MCDSVWNKFQEKFPEIIENNYKYNNIINNILTSPNNILLYCSNGFPIDLFIEIILLKKTNNKSFYRNYHLWEKTINYCENQYFIEIDLMNPENIKNLDKLTKFLLNIVNTKNIGLTKHIIILKHIDLLIKYFYEFRILLEKFSNNIIFISCTHNISKIEAPIKSRYNIYRIPLFTLNEIDEIYKNYLDMSLNDIFYTLRSRDIIKSLFLTEYEEKPSTKDLII